MSSSETDNAKAAGIEDFVLAKVGGRFLRFAAIDAIPQGVDIEGPYDLSKLQDVTKDDLGRMYGALVGCNPKNFKDKRIAIESVAYQIHKMPIFDPSAPKSAPAEKKANGAKSNGEKKYERKANDAFELLSPPDSDQVVKGLAPQARELVLIMVELAKERGTTTFSGADLNAKLSEPGMRERLKTKQETLRILQYYKGSLISKGLIRVS